MSNRNERELVFRVRGKGTWEDRSMMRTGLCMIKGVTQVDELGVSGPCTFESCAEAAAAFAEQAPPTALKVLLDAVELAAGELLELLDEPGDPLLNWANAVCAKLDELAKLRNDIVAFRL